MSRSAASIRLDHDEDDVDQVLARELNNLSFQDRNKIQEEIHGVHSLALEESPSQIQAALKSLKEEIDRTPAAQRQPFDQAASVPNSFVHLEEYRIKFLRAELFDTKNACRRMMTHLRLLAKYFGSDALARPLKVSDFSKKEQSILRSGYIQILPSRDRAGRLVSFDKDSIYASDDKAEMIPRMVLRSSSPPAVIVQCDLDSSPSDTFSSFSSSLQIRLLIYFTSIFAEDEETQRKGFVVVTEPKMNLWEAYQKSSHDHRRDVIDLHLSFPVRMSAMHLCLPEEPEPASKLLRGLIFLGMIAEPNRIRIRVHSALSRVETRYQLMTFGLPVQEFPISSTGTLKNRTHLQWIKTRNVIDKARDDNDVFSGIIHPGVHDVLFSKGGNTTHYGNIEFRYILDSTCPIYSSTTDRVKRRQLRQHIIDFVRDERKGRFLQMDLDGNGWWIEITDMNVLLEKVGTALYDHNRKLIAESKQQQNASETDRFLESPKRRKIGDNSFCFGGNNDLS